jgi:hypothetical protein
MHRRILVAEADSRAAITERDLETNANRVLHADSRSVLG